jgi:hypothetical protein
MARLHEHYREFEPEQTDRYWQAFARRQAIENAEWQYFDELKKSAEGAAAIEAEKADMTRAYADFTYQQTHVNRQNRI